MVDPLTGFVVAITGHRRWEEQHEMLARRGATVLHGPVMHTSLLDDVDATVAATRAALDRRPDLLVLTTGLGTRSWFAACESARLDEALLAWCGDATVIARGSKARSAALGCGIEVDWHAASETGAEVLEHLLGLGVADRNIVVQRDGGEPLLADELTKAGANVVDIPVYQWTPPHDPAPALRLIDAVLDDRVDAVTFTCSYAVQSTLRLATDPGEFVAALGRRARAVAVGPVTAQALRDAGVTRVVEPRRARLGAMVQALITEVSGTAVRLSVGEDSVELRGNALVESSGAVRLLTPRERQLLMRLLSAAPGVLTKEELAGDGVDPHAVEAAIGRLRTKLGVLRSGIVSVPRRGYRSTLTSLAASSENL